MKLNEAFDKALNTYGLLASLGYTKHQIHNMKRNKVSVELMRSVVEKVGYKCVREEDWKLK